MTTSSAAADPVRRAVMACRAHYVTAAVLSGLANLLCLTPTIFMLQVYDRVVPTAGLGSLALLSLIALAAYATLGTLEWLRTRLLLKAGMRIDRLLAGPVLAVMLGGRRPEADRREALRQLDTFRQAMSGPVMTTLFDAPWMPIYVLVAFLLHPWLGTLTVAAGGLLFVLALINERVTHKPIAAAARAAGELQACQGHASAHAADIRALGMRQALSCKILDGRADLADLQLQATLAGGKVGGLMRIIRLILQSVGLAVGAWLAIDGKISGGAIFAVTLLLGRALHPIDQLTRSWKSVVRAREAYADLGRLLAEDRTTDARTALPAPQGRITLENLAVAPLGQRPVVSGASLTIEAGEVIGIAGLSGTGKSTLLATLGGALPPAAGHVRLDGASIEDWDADQLGRRIGYLPQSYVLFAGTVKENITRFAGVLGASEAVIDAAAIAAAQMAGAHEMILRLPQGYDTPIGDGGAGLSAGQAQRIALARALYGEPRVLLLDEPYAHLDSEGQAELLALIGRMKARGCTVLITAHQADMLSAADKVMLLGNGRVARFGAIHLGTPAVHALKEKRA
jgi:PrtD family type I secretion system ABC transporter